MLKQLAASTFDYYVCIKEQGCYKLCGSQLANSPS